MKLLYVLPEVKNEEIIIAPVMQYGEGIASFNNITEIPACALGQLFECKDGENGDGPDAFKVDAILCLKVDDSVPFIGPVSFKVNVACDAGGTEAVGPIAATGCTLMLSSEIQGFCGAVGAVAYACDISEDCSAIGDVCQSDSGPIAPLEVVTPNGNTLPCTNLLLIDGDNGNN